MAAGNPLAVEAGAAASAFAPDGPLARSLPGFRSRAQQRAMAEAVAASFADGEHLVCEAGTGTGKTLAYLIPALAHGGRVVISTATRNLQDQLFDKDLPLARDAVARPVDIALLKGRSNYLCTYRLRSTAERGHYLPPADESLLERIRVWAKLTVAGDIAEMDEVPEDAPVWRHATSTLDNCLGQECPDIGACHVLRARRRAMDADVVVVNHHLLLADLALKEEGFGELLPGVDAVVLDEAHQLPDIAGRFFGVTVSSAQIAGWSRDAVSAVDTDAPEVRDVARRAATLERAIGDLRSRMGATSRRATAAELGLDAPVLDVLREAVAALHAALEPLGERSKSLDACARRGAVILARWPVAVSGDADGDRVRWVEVTRRGFAFHSSPLDIAPLFREHVDRSGAAWVLTSATLSVAGSLAPFAERVGLADAAQIVWDSPFDFETQALGYLPAGLPDPRSPGFRAAFAEVAIRVLEAAGGGSFVLFTSYAALNEAADRLRLRLRLPLLVQGDAPRAQLLRRFRETPGAVLLGTQSFWEGVDVRGEALGCVIIEKLPFAPPGDPVLRARAERMRARGEDAFSRVQIPQAVLALKQGVGRLIRDDDDRGVVVICDPRVRTKGYGRVFLKSLPPMPFTNSMEDVVAFFEHGRSRKGAR